MNRVQHLMDTLNISEEEAKQVLKDDDAIDHGAKLFELNADQKKVEKKMRQADRKVTAYKFTQRERKANDSKRKLLVTLVDALVEQNLIDDSTLHIENVERDFTFCMEGTKYKVVLSAPRK